MATLSSFKNVFTEKEKAPFKAGYKTKTVEIYFRPDFSLRDAKAVKAFLLTMIKHEELENGKS